MSTWARGDRAEGALNSSRGAPLDALGRREELTLVEDDGRGARGGSCPGKFPDNCHLSRLSQRVRMPPHGPYQP